MIENANIIEGVLNNFDGVLMIFFILFAVALIPFYKIF